MASSKSHQEALVDVVAVTTVALFDLSERRPFPRIRVGALTIPRNILRFRGGIFTTGHRLCGVAPVKAIHDCVKCEMGRDFEREKKHK